MKKVLIFAILFTIGISAYSQGTLAVKAKQLNAGLGFSGWGLPVYVGFDYGFRPNVTLGGELSFRSYREKFLGTTYGHSIIGVSGNGNYHFNELLDLDGEWDLYAGLNLGFYVWNSPKAYAGSGTSGLDLGGQVGGRYFFNSRTGLNLEFGGGTAFSGGKFGITHKF